MRAAPPAHVSGLPESTAELIAGSECGFLLALYIVGRTTDD